MQAKYRKLVVRGNVQHGVSVRHSNACPRALADTGKPCSCEPSYRGTRRHPVTKAPEKSPSFKTPDAVKSWLAGATGESGAAIRKRAALGPTFGEVATQWWEGVQSGAIGKRRGASRGGYSPTTLPSYRLALFGAAAEYNSGKAPSRAPALVAEFGGRPAAGISTKEWQAFVDRLGTAGLSRSAIAGIVAVARSVYAWAARPGREIVPSNPLVGVEIVGKPEVRRERVADSAEAEALLAALPADDAVIYALAFYAGLRRAEIHRLEWADVDLDGYRLVVRKAKSAAGTNRRPPIAEPLRAILLAAKLRATPDATKVAARSVMSGKLAEHARKAWTAAGLAPIGLHECRHTYVSWLIAAGFDLAEIMAYVGHSDLQMVQRYMKLIGRPDESDPAERLNAYLRRRAS